MDQRILEFHGVGPAPRTFDDNEGDYWVSVAQFDEALNIVAALQRRPDDIVLTFDDGNRSDYEIAFPRLVARGLKGHFFVLAGRLASSCSLAPWQIAEMAAVGMTIGLHGHDHVSWREASDAALDKEIASARAALAVAAKSEIADVAIPFGRYNGRVMRRLARSGFRTVYTSDGGRAGSGDWVKPRMTVKRDTDGRALRAMLDGDEPLTRRGLRQTKMLVKRWL